MSTSFFNGDADFSSEGTRTLNLRGFLSEAVFVGADDIAVSRCVNRADKCRPGDVFFPQHTAAGDEHDRVEEAVQRGAVAVVAERLLPVNVPQCLVDNTQEAFGQVCQGLAGDPSQRMLTIAVVGSYGKTTTSLFVAAMLKKLGGSVAYYTSLGASDSTQCDRSATRPPSARKLAKWMEQADLSGAPAAIIELTPAMIHNRAIAGIEFDLVILTGLRPGQFRGSPTVRQQTQLLDGLVDRMKSHGMVLYNADDAQASAWAEQAGIASVSYGLDAAEHVRAKRLSRQGGEQQILAMTGHTLMPLTLKMPGDHIARAALAAVATSWMFDFSVPKAIAGIESLTSIPGRMQRLSQAVDVPVYLDDAETPDRLAVALHALRQHQLGQATVVLDLSTRLDPKWRQRLGEVLDRSGAKVVLSAADLAPEAAQSVAMDVLGGFRSPGRVHVIPDRTAAIEWAVENTPAGCILLAGCGARQWTGKYGELLSDETIAAKAVSGSNHALPMPILAVFPPSDPSVFFPIDS